MFEVSVSNPGTEANYIMMINTNNRRTAAETMVGLLIKKHGFSKDNKIFTLRKQDKEKVCDNAYYQKCLFGVLLMPELVPAFKKDPVGFMAMGSEYMCHWFSIEMKPFKFNTLTDDPLEACENRDREYKLRFAHLSLPQLAELNRVFEENRRIRRVFRLE